MSGSLRIAKTYSQGLREGKRDGAHHKDHSKKRHFNKDEDQKAYEAGSKRATAINGSG